MARPFSYPEVQQLEVGESATVPDGVSLVQRRVFAYGKRAGRTFLITPPEPDRGYPLVKVTRMMPPLGGHNAV